MQIFVPQLLSYAGVFWDVIKEGTSLSHCADFLPSIFFLSAGSLENSGECPVDMLLFPWEHDKLPSQEEVMEIFHLNTNLRLDVTYERSEKSFAEGKELERIFKCRRKLPSESIFYEALPKVLDDG